MATEVLMPQMGESIAEGTITRWLVQVGDHVERDQLLLEISTDKVDAEIPSPESGVVLEIRHAEGETVEVDTVIAVIGAAGEEAAVPPPAAATGTEPTPAPAAVAPAPAGPASLAERLRTFSSPLVRRIAADEGVDLAEVEGTGLHGRVTKQDILTYLESGRAAAAAARTEKPARAPAIEQRAPAAVAVARPAATPAARHEPAAPLAQASPFEGFSVPPYREGEQVRLEPMSRIRQITAAHMLYSQQTSAHVATVFDVDLSRIVALRNQVKDKFARQVGTKLTFMPFVFQAVIAGLKAHPKFNASVAGTDIAYKRDINLGMAVALDWGLIVPVIARADELSLVGLAQRANDLAERARSKSLRPEEVQGGTFTITNPGVYGSLFGLPMINQPQVAILCVGAVEKRPVVVTDRNGNDAIAIRSMAYLALSYDHRIIDGADAERFMVTVKSVLTDGDWGELSAYS